ncbi:MAG: hypothetical protein ULS35scaffold63_15 [Phage 33_17]|nr:MAG: hypothetical protein ULS35scaffold63_15 [Phage 33_17]
MLTNRTIPTEITQETLKEETPEIENINLEDVKEGKVDIYNIPHEERKRLEQEEYESLDEEAKKAWQGGWRSEPFFGGKNKDGSDRPWMDYQEFNRKAQEIAPIRNERLRDLGKENEELKHIIQDMNKQIKELASYNKIKEEREISQRAFDLERQMMQAREDQDFQSWETLQKQKIELEKTKYKFQEPEPTETPYDSNSPQPLNHDQRAAIGSWMQENSWYGSDPELTLEADNYFQQVISQTLHKVPMRNNLQAMKQKVIEKYPSKFETKPPIHVESSTNSAFGSISSKKTYWNLPPADKRLCDAGVASGLITREQYVANYFKLNPQK